MKRRLLLGIALMAMMATLSCARHDHERYFEAIPVAGGASVQITSYLGGNWEVRIPPRIRNLPVPHRRKCIYGEQSG